MQIPKNIKITDAAGKTVAFLSPKADALKDVYADGRLNGESTLEFILPSNSEKISELTPECQIWANNRVYNLLKDEAIDTVMDDKGKTWSKFMAVERWNQLNTEYIEPYISNDPSIPFPADLAVIIVGGGTNLSGDLYPTGTAAHALYAVLQGSDWTMGICDVTGIHDLEMEKESRLAIIKQIQDTWGGFLVWDSVNKVVHLRNSDLWQNYTGFQIRYAKNLKHITRTQSNKLTTRLFCFGKDNLDIASINDGKKYLTDFSYTNNVYTDKYINLDIEDPQELKQKGLAELALNCKPRHNYKVKVVDLRTLPEYSHEDFSLGDMADVVNPMLCINEQVRLIRHKYNIFAPWQCEFELGDPLKRLVEDLKASFDTTGFIDNIFDSSGKLSGWNLVDGSIINNKIANAALDASKFNTKQIILTDDIWQDNTPSSGYVAWNAHKLFYGGIEYDILGCNTDKKYIVWQKSINPNFYQFYTEEEFANITLADSDFVIAVNNDGLHDIAWYSRLARQFIGSVFIADAAIKTAHIGLAQVVDANIANLSASKISAGIINATGAIYLGDTSFALVAADKQLIVKDKQDIPETRVIVGHNDNDYGIWVYNESGKEILGASGLGFSVVDTSQIVNGAVTNAKIDSLSANKITAGTIDVTVSLTAAEITSESYINITTDAYIGDNIYLGDITQNNTKTIYFNNLARIVGGSGEWGGDLKIISDNLNLENTSKIDWGNNYPVARFAP